MKRFYMMAAIDLPDDFSIKSKKMETIKSRDALKHIIAYGDHTDLFCESKDDKECEAFERALAVLDEYLDRVRKHGRNLVVTYSDIDAMNGERDCWRIYHADTNKDQNDYEAMGGDDIHMQFVNHRAKEEE